MNRHNPEKQKINQRRTAKTLAYKATHPEPQLYRADKKWRAANHAARTAIREAEKRLLTQGRTPQ